MPKSDWHIMRQRGALGLAVALAALAGWVDATGFMLFRELFVSFVSGNSTKAAVSLGVDWREAIPPLRAIAAFAFGVVIGETLGTVAKGWRRPAVLMLEAGLLWSAVAALTWGAGEAVEASIIGVAMGVQNAFVHQVGGINVALTYVTGTIVQVGRAVSKALLGAGPWGAALPYLALWLGLVAGGIAGAFVTRSSPIGALIAAAGFATTLAALTVASRLRVKRVSRS